MAAIKIPMDPSVPKARDASPRARIAKPRLRAGLLAVWAICSFGVVFFARDLDTVVAGWPLNFWYCSQGAILLYIVIVTLYAWR